jgi:predicted nuclease with TOPRIM domain
MAENESKEINLLERKIATLQKECMELRRSKEEAEEAEEKAIEKEKELEKCLKKRDCEGKERDSKLIRLEQENKEIGEKGKELEKKLATQEIKFSDLRGLLCLVFSLLFSVYHYNF